MEKKSGPSSMFTISKRFIIAVAVIYSLLIITTSLAVHLSLRMNSDMLKKTVDEYTTQTLLERAMTVKQGLAMRKADSVLSISSVIKDVCTEEAGFLYAIVYSKTDDENFFKVQDTVTMSGTTPLPVSRDDVVREKKDINYLKAGLITETSDTDIYTWDDRPGQHVYIPYTAGKKRLVIQFMMSTPTAAAALDRFSLSTGRVRIITAIASVALVIAVVALTVLFLQNYSLLLTNLSRYMSEAAQGNLELSLNTAADQELQQLAVSFNSLIEEMKDIKDVHEKAAADAISASELFKTAVAMMKEQRYAEASHLFRTLIHSERFLFGSYFNLGVACAKSRSFDESLALFEKARELNPSHELTLQYIDKVRRLMALHE